jgi:hypothetical protein
MSPLLYERFTDDGPSRIPGQDLAVLVAILFRYEVEMVKLNIALAGTSFEFLMKVHIII